MPTKIKVIWSTIVLVVFLFGFFGWRIQDWDTAMTSWLDSETWIINHSSNPSLVLIGIVLLFGTIVLPEAWWFVRRHLEAMEQRGVSQHEMVFLPSKTIFEVAAYLKSASSWGWRKYSIVNFWDIVEALVCDEIHRAASRGEVRIIGTQVTIGTSWPIDPGYWHDSKIDPLRIWDSRNRSQTIPGPHQDAGQYVDLRIPNTDIERTWPRASPAFRLWIRFVIVVRHFWLKHLKMYPLGGTASPKARDQINRNAGGIMRP